MRRTRQLLPLLLCLSMLASTGMAQRSFRKPLKETDYRSKFSNYHVELRLGCPWSLLTKSDIDPNYLGHFGGQLGITAERSFQSFSVGLEFLWAQRGTRMYGETTFQSSLHETEMMRYETAIAYDVIALRAPLTWYLLPPASTKVTPYVFVAPAIEHALNKRLNLPANSLQAFLQEPLTVPTITRIENIGGQESSETNAWNPPFLNAIVLAGTGAMVNFPAKTVSFHLKFDVGVNVGVLNLASKALKEQGVSIRSYGLEAGLTLLFDINPPLRDACYYFQKFNK